MHCKSVWPHVSVIPITSYPPAVTSASALGKFQMVSMVLEADSKGCSVCAWERAPSVGSVLLQGGGGGGRGRSSPLMKGYRFRGVMER